jgi:hypothetical protein
LSCLKSYISILYCCNCWYNYECIFVIAPWGTLIGIKYCIVLYCIVKGKFGVCFSRISFFNLLLYISNVKDISRCYTMFVLICKLFIYKIGNQMLFFLSSITFCSMNICMKKVPVYLTKCGTTLAPQNVYHHHNPQQCKIIKSKNLKI